MNLKLNRLKVRSMLPKRKPDVHKGNVGKLLLLCGSVGYTGAAALAATAALRTGAGLVYLGVPESIYTIMASKLTVPVVFPLPEFEGKLCIESIPIIRKYLSKVDAVLIGPGLGVSDKTEAVVRCVLKEFTGPVILDADGITVMNSHKDILRDRTGHTVITPHEGEFCRFSGIDGINDRATSAIELAARLNCVVVLKGHRTIITDGEIVYRNMTGNSGMAVGGSGDVLAGIIVSLIGQGMNPLTAAACGAWIHGEAGDICAKKIGRYGLIPTDLLRVLPRLIR